MEIKLNDQPYRIAENSTLRDVILQELGEKQLGIALALNQEVIPKTRWAEILLKAGDDVLIIRATQGG